MILLKPCSLIQQPHETISQKYSSLFVSTTTRVRYPSLVASLKGSFSRGFYFQTLSRLPSQPSAPYRRQLPTFWLERANRHLQQLKTRATQHETCLIRPSYSWYSSITTESTFMESGNSQTHPGPTHGHDEQGLNPSLSTRRAAQLPVFSLPQRGSDVPSRSSVIHNALPFSPCGCPVGKFPSSLVTFAGGRRGFLSSRRLSSRQLPGPAMNSQPRPCSRNFLLLPNSLLPLFSIAFPAKTLCLLTSANK